MKKIAAIFAITGVFLPTIAMARFNSWCPGYGGRFLGFGYGGLFMGILWIAVLVAAGFFFMKMLRNRDVFSNAGGGESPIEILKKRYARGELSKEDFDRMKQELA